MLLMAACRSGPQKAPAIGEAYVGPAALKLRADIPLESATVVTVKHGDRLEILQRRRKFLRVRAPGGAEGWTDERQLLAAADMRNLKALSEQAAGMPSQGLATTFNDIRVHTQPSVQSPSFLLIKENEKFDVVASILVPRTDLPRVPLIPPAPKKAPVPKKPAKEPKVPPIALPKPPSAPKNWLELSKTDLEEAPPEEHDEPETKPVPTDSWSLIRFGGQAGWVLTRYARMAIPDEVAQYAEGRRIVSYFPLAEVQDGDQKKKIWLWTTVGGSGHAYDFDSFRVFVWSLRKHRYETAYIERNLQGYAPVLLQEVELASGGNRGKQTAAKYAGFSICMDGRDGQRHRREYALLGNIVRYAGDRACEPAPALEIAKAAIPPAGVPEAAPAASEAGQQESIWQRLKRKVRSTIHGH